jgi:hypothetical protein
MTLRIASATTSTGLRPPRLWQARVRLGIVPFGTLLLSVIAMRDIEIAAPHLQQLPRERHGAELLALCGDPTQDLLRWLQRCGSGCAKFFSRALAPGAGVQAVLH